MDRLGRNLTVASRRALGLMAFFLFSLCAKGLDVTPYVETLGNPFANRYNTAQTAPARSATRMRLYNNDRIFLGHGTTTTALQTGPVDVWTIDLSSDSFVKNGFVFEEIIDQIRVFGDRAYISGRDSMGQGAMYRFEPAKGWQMIPVGGDGHYFDVYEFQNSIMTFAGDGAFPEVALAGINGGPFSKFPLGTTAGTGAEFFEYKGSLYGTITRNADPADPAFMSKISAQGVITTVHSRFTNFFQWGPFSTNTQDSFLSPIREFVQFNDNLAVFISKSSLHYTTDLEAPLSGIQLTNQPAGLPEGNIFTGVGAAAIRKYGDTLYVAYNIKVGNDFWVALCESTDGLIWTEKFRFTKGSRARSFERAPNGDFYFGAFGVFSAQNEKLIPGDIWRVRAQAASEVPSLPLVGLSADRMEIFEGAGVPLSVRIRRAGPTNSALTVKFSVAGTAVADTDFSPPSGSAIVPAGAESVVFPITILNNPVVTGPRVLTVSLNPDAAYSIASPAMLNFTISETVAGTKLPSHGLALWLRADRGVTAAENGVVSEWLDQSGRGFVARQTVANQRPTLVPLGQNGRPAIQFDGSNDWLDIGPIGAEAYHTAIVFSNNAALSTASSKTLVNYMSYAEGGGTGLDIGDAQSGITGELVGIYNQFWQGGADTIAAGAHVLALSQPAVSAPFTLKIDGASKPITVNRPFRIITPNCEQVRIASRTGTTGSRFFGGAISEIIIYNRPLSANEAALVEAHLNERYFAAVNQPPVPGADQVSRDAGQGLDIPVANLLANDTDPDGDTLSVVSVGSALPAGAGVALNAGVITYSPPAGNDLAGSFTYEISDGHGGTAVGLVAVSVLTPNQPPVAVNDAFQRQSKNDLLVTFAQLLGNDSDPDLESFTVTAVTPATAGGATVTIEAGSIRYHPPPGFNGSDSFGYTITDARGLTAAAQVNVTVSNAAPIATADSRSRDSGQNLSISAISLLANDSDPDGDPINVVSVGSPLPEGAGVTLEGGTVFYTPPAGNDAGGSFTYEISDGRGGTSVALVTVSVIIPNRPPVAANDIFERQSKSDLVVLAAQLLANDSDPDLDVITVTAVTPTTAAGAAVTIEENSIRYHPLAGFNGSDSFGYTITDARGLTASAQVNVTVSNVAPVATADSRSRDSGQALSIFASSLLENDSDADGDIISVTSVALPLPEGANVTLQNGVILYTPPAGNDSSGSFTYEISDGRGGSASASVSISVAVGNRPPVAAADSFERQSKNDLIVAFGQLLANDSDPDLEVLTITAVTPTTAGGGTVQIEGDSIRYHPPDGSNGPDSFGYTIQDARGLTASGVVNISVSNAAPVAANDARSGGIGQALAIAISGLVANDSDADGDTIEFLSVAETSSAGGLLAVNGLNVVYSPPAGLIGQDSFTYKIRDARGLTSEGVVTTVPVRLEIRRLETPEGALIVRIEGAPGSTLELQKSADPGANPWSRVNEVNLGQSGFVEIEESSMDGGGFFRAVILSP